MKIESISSRGIRELYSFYADIYKTPNAKKFNDGRRKHFLLDHITVSFVISEITSIDFFILQNFSNGSAHCIHTDLKENDELGVYPGIEDNSLHDEEVLIREKTVRLIDQINMDTDIINAARDLFSYPATEKVKAYIEFSGMQVLSLLQKEDIFRIFEEWLGDLILLPQTDEKSTPQYLFQPVEEVFDNPVSMYRPRKSFEDYACEKFISGFYEYYAMFIDMVDLVSDSFIHTTVYHGVVSGDTKFLEVITPVVSINMCGDPNFTEKIEKLQKVVSEDSEFIGERSSVMDFIKIRVCTRQSLRTFLQIVEKYPFSFVRNWTDLKIVASTMSTVSIPKLDQYEVRINNLYNRIHKQRSEVMAKNKLIGINYIPFGTPISFTLEASIAEWEQYIGEWEMVATKNSDTGWGFERDKIRAKEESKNHLFDYEMGLIFEKVSTFIQAISRSL